MLKEFNCFLIRHTKFWTLLVRLLSILLLLLILLAQVFSMSRSELFQRLPLFNCSVFCSFRWRLSISPWQRGRRRLLTALWWRWRWWIWVRPLVWSCSPCGSLSSLTSSFKGGTWCRLGLRSGSLVPSFVGWSCRDFFIWFCQMVLQGFLQLI